ncbi:Flavin-dependent oxidoreductase, luciferase family (includes alkanesulfonate monooxygenase SsuD and methylene tetrahydromethanopterin reductase) [Saccharopolyspora antimicrobica]|uniref:Alkanesulfonate monooxygenase SsuD/methylene tetrahydromethanopterin reductase-like flavin-dependent oxidoreductase (Luciferase family) n=2 Tax=Saccharopolyspora antimicrobica TaxID=455193 RepID=A0A1I4QJE7_9PSEU|nr:alkanesulfonate monooxygenase SsuD/methylene tetrahydromethanopterin reductase-like flavin-dependent oxidoreductase (luciferase family) [Saccharopolyspora antimicrobica]SFM40181.1 Flavin-dependent oxidoreductase, luciferase family (includes alkanesulfonate monooxygenase SsuD and methylene tetrahydromethanopterin reductase) [Saccharopolyspora antimicrobica]
MTSAVAHARRKDDLQMAPPELHLAVALDGAGWHPAAWRRPQARPAELFSARYWVDLALEAERGLLDLITFEDALGPQSSRDDGPDDRTDQVRGRLDAGLIAARVAPRTQRIGLVPGVVITHTEPFHISKAVASLDYISNGRAGWQPKVSGLRSEAAHFGRREVHTAELFDEAADHVEVVRRLWDSWEDDAEIRDVATGRFIDRAKLHYIDFAGKWFDVKGPSITPRPPQGQPLVTALATDSAGHRFAARAADVVFTTPHDVEQARLVESRIRAEQAEAGREQDRLHVFGDIAVFLGADAADRKAGLDELDGAEYTSDAPVFTGTAAELADRLQAWSAAGLTGFRLRPGAIPEDLTAITRELVPELQRRGLFRTSYDTGSLRGRLGLPRPASRYATTSGGRP